MVDRPQVRHEGGPPRAARPVPLRVHELVHEPARVRGLQRAGTRAGKSNARAQAHARHPKRLEDDLPVDIAADRGIMSKRAYCRKEFI